MNVRKLVSLCAVALVLSGLASASVKNTLSFKEDANPKPTTISLTKFNYGAGSTASNSKLKTGGQPPKQVTFEFKPGKTVPSEFKPQGAIDVLSVETEVNVPGQTKVSQTTTFTKVVITSITVTGTGNNTRETVEFLYDSVATTRKT